MSAHAFDFDIPEKASDWFKFSEGEQKIRLLSEPIRGWEEWSEVNGKRSPVRYHYEDKPDSPINPDKPVKIFIASIVWNYTNKKIEIFHCDRISIIRELKKLAEDADWGSLYGYDVRIKREGKDQQTRYTVTPLPQKPLDTAVVKAFHDKPIDLDEIFNNGDPFKPMGVTTPLAIKGPSAASQLPDKLFKLREPLFDADCAVERLNDYVEFYANAKKVTTEKIVDSCLLLPAATLVNNFNNWVAKNPIEELPF